MDVSPDRNIIRSSKHWALHKLSSATAYCSRLVALVALIAMAPASVIAGPGGPTGSTTDGALFKHYAVAQVYRGPVRLPDFRGRDRFFADFRTRIREGIRQGVNFAGHYAIIGWGCGTDCSDYVIGDVVTGRVFRFPLGGDYNLQLDLDTKPTSRLIVARWFSYTHKFTKDNLSIMNCFRQYLIWNGSSAVPLSTPAIIATIAEPDLCDDR
jgi:hypothetical protein